MFFDGRIGWGGNSGFQALNLAAVLGCRRIVLVGYDMHLEDGPHWHGRHDGPLNNPLPGKVSQWIQRLDGAAVELRERGIEVINASLNSALTGFRKAPFAVALEEALA